MDGAHRLHQFSLHGLALWRWSVSDLRRESIYGVFCLGKGYLWFVSERNSNMKRQTGKRLILAIYMRSMDGSKSEEQASPVAVAAGGRLKRHTAAAAHGRLRRRSSEAADCGNMQKKWGTDRCNVQFKIGSEEEEGVKWITNGWKGIILFLFKKRTKHKINIEFQFFNNYNKQIICAHVVNDYYRWFFILFAMLVKLLQENECDNYLTVLNRVTEKIVVPATLLKLKHLLVCMKIRGGEIIEKNNSSRRSDMITNCFCVVWRWWLPTKISSSVLPLGDSLEDSIVDPFCLVVELQVAQHHNSTQHKSSWVCQVLQAIEYHSVKSKTRVILITWMKDMV
jgi:hypothetical protein